jgi:N utilization substance protein A
MGPTLSEAARRQMVEFADITGVKPRDCVIQAAHDLVVFLVPAGEIATAIGADGQLIETVEAELGQAVKLVEDAAEPAAFVANALAPAEVLNVTISEINSTVAYVEVDHADTGAAIGTDGQNIEAARTLAARHFDIADIELT